MIYLDNMEVLRERVTFIQAGDKFRAEFNFETNLYDIYCENLNQHKFSKSVNAGWIVIALSRFAQFTGQFGDILWDLKQTKPKELYVQECNSGGYEFI